MNPLRWKREHQVALAVAALIGAFVGPLVGYALYAAGSGAEGAIGLNYWFTGRRIGNLLWAIPGAAIGAGIVYALRLARA
jgi:hypothetical protein